jgi:hypothetical protein
VRPLPSAHRLPQDAAVVITAIAGKFADFRLAAHHEMSFNAKLATPSRLLELDIDICTNRRQSI